MGVPGKLYLLPVPIAESPVNEYIPDYNFDVVRRLRFFIAEDLKTARRFLKWFGYQKIDQAEMLLLNEHTSDTQTSLLLEPLLAGNDVGLMSDAGCPGIADPGATVVALAHSHGITVVPLSGPSSIVLSIMASGFNGQNFAFNGYLPIDKALRVKRLKELEFLARKQRQAQFFIETPYRNGHLFQAIMENLQGDTLLFLGVDMTSASQKLISKTVTNWKKSAAPDIHKVPVVFGIYQ